MKFKVKTKRDLIWELMADFRSSFLRRFGFYPSEAQERKVKTQIAHFVNNGVKVRLKKEAP